MTRKFKLYFYVLPFIIFHNLIYSYHLNSNLPNDKPIVIVGNYKILLGEFSERYFNYLNATGIKDNPFTRRSILNNMINETLLTHYDDNSKILNDKNFKDEIGWSKKQTILAYLKDQEVYAKITVTDDELRDAFLRSNENIAARHLYATTEEEANNLFELLKIGIDFDFLAAQIFTDSTLRNNGGYLGYFSWGDMDPAFEDAAYSLDIGEISHPVKTTYGYSIIKLEDRVSHPLLTETEFIQKKSHLERALKIKKKKTSERDYLNKIYNRKKTTFNDENIKELFLSLTETQLSSIENRKLKTSSLLCAKYEGKSYTQSEILKRINELPIYHKEKIISFDKLTSAIEGFIVQDKLLGIAKSKGYDTLPVVKDAYKNLNEYILLKYKKNEIADRTEIPDSLIHNYYKENLHLFSSEDELNVQEIIVTDKSLADSIRLLLDNGGEFGILAKQYSIRKWSAENNGVMGYAPLSRFGMLKEKFWNSPISEIIGPIAIGNIYGLFKVLDRKPGKPKDFNVTKDQVAQALKLEQRNKIIMDYIENLWKKVNIQVDESTLTTYKF